MLYNVENENGDYECEQPHEFSQRHAEQCEAFDRAFFSRVARNALQRRDAELDVLIEIDAQIRRAARNFAISSRKSLWQAKKNASLGAKASMPSPRGLVSGITSAMPSSAATRTCLSSGTASRRPSTEAAVSQRKDSSVDGWKS